jgi:hypothetical protein
MKIEQIFWNKESGWKILTNTKFNYPPQLVMIFGGVNVLANFQEEGRWLKNRFPNSIWIGCSTAGEIIGGRVTDESLSVTAIEFEKATLEFSFVEINSVENSFDAGVKLIKQLPQENLKNVFVISEGVKINGTELVQGMRSVLTDKVLLTGGLAADAGKFQKTYLFDKNKEIRSGCITAIGFYGNALEVGCGSFGGWTSFGKERQVTRSHKNILYELDGQPALKLYKTYLGAEAANLPASGLLFPLSISSNNNQEPLVRTLLAVNEFEQSLTFAGDIPEGAMVKLMKAKTDDLIEGAENAGKIARNGIQNSPDLAILVSCVGRKLVMKQLIEEEVEAVWQILGKNTTITGYYSNGEIAPFSQDVTCDLHNQTMTITTFKEL